jgi:hypothetical protein
MRTKLGHLGDDGTTGLGPVQRASVCRDRRAQFASLITLLPLDLRISIKEAAARQMLRRRLTSSPLGVTSGNRSFKENLRQHVLGSPKSSTARLNEMLTERNYLYILAKANSLF